MSNNEIVNNVVANEIAIVSLREARRDFERRYILEILERHQWQISQTARALGLQRPNLYRKARQLRIQLKRPVESV